MLDIQNLNAGYGEMPVLRAINLTIGDGEIVSVVGSNGAGKSTMLKAISGIIKYNGSITWKSESLQDVKAHTIVKPKFPSQKPHNLLICDKIQRFCVFCTHVNYVKAFVL